MKMLPDVIRRKGVTAGSWMDGVGESSRFLPVAWYDGLERILTKFEENGAGRRVCWMPILP